MPQPPEPSHLFDAFLPKWSEVKQTVDRARAASAPGPNSVPYRVYKSCPRLLKLLWRLIRVVWKTQAIPSEWNKAVTIFITKEKDFQSINQLARANP